MNIFDRLLKEALLCEITLQDHFDSYINGKYDLDFDKYRTIARLDPTTADNRKGKYVDWILKTMMTPEGKWNVKVAYFADVQDEFKKFIKKPVDINQFKSYDAFKEYTDSIPEKSNREVKKAKKDIFNSPDDIKILSVTDEWIILQTLTREGNIMGAQYKCEKQANWCTAYLNDDKYWKQYSRDGDLIQIINKEDPKDKYQVYIVDGAIKEERDYNDNTSSVAYKILIDDQDFIDNYGKIEERPQFKYTWDEEGAAQELVSENGVYDDRAYLNREPEGDDERDYYREEASNNEEYQINHWDRFLKNCYEIYANESGGKYFDEDRMKNISGYFINPITRDDTDKEPAKEAVYEMCEDFEGEWEEWIDDEDEDKPTDDDELDDWYKDKEAEFLRKNKTRWDFIEYFLDDFPYNFKFDTLLSGRIDNSDQQISFNYESLINKLRGRTI